MDRKYQVFISSTYEDLKEQRDAVVKAVLKMGHLPVGMEMFNAADQQQWEIIKRHIDNSDYYVLIMAHRYGSIGPKGMSYTQHEYEYAVEKGIPCLGFVLHKDTLWPSTMMETGTAKKKLDGFKKKVGERPVNFWDTTDKLALQVFASLSESITLSPRPGWVRASETAGPQVAEELARLSRENEMLRAQHSADEFAEVKIALRNELYSSKLGNDTLNFNLGDVFAVICEKPDDTYAPSIYRRLVKRVNGLDTGDLYINGSVYEPVLGPALQELELLGIARAEHTFTSDLYNWALTEKALRLYTNLKYGLRKLE